MVNGIATLNNKIKNFNKSEFIFIFSPYALPLIILACFISTAHVNDFYYSHDEVKWWLFDVTSSIIVVHYFIRRKTVIFSYVGVICLVLLYMMITSLWWSANPFEGIEFILRFLNACLLSYVLLNSYNSDQLIKLVLFSSFISAMTFCIVFFIERYVFKVPYNNGTFTPIGFTNNAGHVFNIWVPCLIAFCYQCRKNTLLFFLCCIVTLCTMHILMEVASRGNIWGLLFSEIFVLIACIFYKNKITLNNVIISVLLGISIFIYFNLDDNQRTINKTTSVKSVTSDSGRFPMFKNTFDMILDNPFGVGINNFEYEHAKYAKAGTSFSSPFVNEKQVLTTPHNTILKIASEIGLIGGLFFTLLLFIIWLNSAMLLRDGGKVEAWFFIAASSTLFHSLFSAVFLNPASLFFSILLFSAILRKRKKMNITIQFEVKPVLVIIFSLIPMLSTIGLSSHYFSFKGKAQGNALYLEKAIALNPGNTRAYFHLASLYLYKEKDVQKSIYYINKLIKYYPYNISGLTFLAKRQIQKKSWYEANKTINKILSFYPNYKQAQHMQVTIERHL